MVRPAAPNHVHAPEDRALGQWRMFPDVPLCFFPLVSAYQGLRLLVLSCTILYHLNLCKTIFCCSRFLWTIHHLEDGLQRCFWNSVWICLLDLVNAHLKVTVCMGFRRVLEISPAATYIYGEECSIDDPCQSLVPADVIRTVQNAQ